MVQVLAISRYDGRGTISLQDSVKSQHILPFFPNFVAWARRLEELLVGTEAEATGETLNIPAALRLPFQGLPFLCDSLDCQGCVPERHLPKPCCLLNGGVRLMLALACLISFL